jgi:hypothetical protein
MPGGMQGGSVHALADCCASCGQAVGTPRRRVNRHLTVHRIIRCQQPDAKEAQQRHQQAD